jgi:hypothetical protein
MILIAPREKTALRPGRLLLVPTGRSFLSLFALPSRRGPAYANACEMILLHDGKVKRPGIILLHKMTVRPGSASRTNDVSPGNPFRICTLEENSSRRGRAGKSFTMISLCDDKNNIPGMILLHKNVGGTPSGAHFRCQSGDPASPPRKGYQQDALFAGSKVVPSDEPERRTSHGFAKSPAMRTYPHSVRDIISLRNSKGASRMTGIARSIQWSTCDA